MITLENPKTTAIGVLLILAGAFQLLGIGGEPVTWDFQHIATVVVEFAAGAGFIASGDAANKKNS